MLKKIALKFFRTLTPQYGNHALLVWKNKWQNLFLKKQDHKYVFILSPPYCGSTLLNQLISTSKSVSVNNEVDTREGQTLPTLSKLMFHHDRRWDDTLDYDWEFVKKEWHKYWDLKHPLLLEKSPPNIVRAKSIENHFKPAYFIIFNRNPYAHCESLIRRNGTDPVKAADFAIKCLNLQKKNLLELKSEKVHISYELLTDDTASALKLMADILPELKDIDYNREFSAHNLHSKDMKISNLNEEKIKNLKPKELQAINLVFKNHVDILDFFGYKLIHV